MARPAKGKAHQAAKKVAHHMDKAAKHHAKAAEHHEMAKKHAEMMKHEKTEKKLIGKLDKMHSKKSMKKMK